MRDKREVKEYSSRKIKGKMKEERRKEDECVCDKDSSSPNVLISLQFTNDRRVSCREENMEMEIKQRQDDKNENIEKRYILKEIY